jgi:hypothetical protein
MPSALGACIEAEPTIVGPRHLARHGDLAAADQPHIGHGLVGGVTRLRGQARRGVQMTRELPTRLGPPRPYLQPPAMRLQRG